MGKNTQERQEFIIDNLRVEKDLAVELSEDPGESEAEDNLEKAS